MHFVYRCSFLNGLDFQGPPLPMACKSLRSPPYKQLVQLIFDPRIASSGGMVEKTEGGAEKGDGGGGRWGT
jgi:hypothetical protein